MTDDIAQHKDEVLNNLIVFFSSLKRLEGDFVTVHDTAIRGLVGIGRIATFSGV